MSEPVIELRGLHKSYRDGRRTVPVLCGVDLTVYPGESVAIVGASGEGKSTLLHLMGGLDKPTQGAVYVGGRSLASLGAAALGRLRNEQLGFVYQFHHLLPEFTAEENVAMPAIIGGMAVAEARAAARELLSAVGLTQRFTHKPGALSGGERQRAAVARALITEPWCLLADEPTGNLDSETAAQVFKQICLLQLKRNTALILVTHDQSLARKVDRICYLASGTLEASDRC